MKKFLPLTLARRELRAGARGFRILIACLALGVGTIASVQSLSRDVLGGIESQGRTLLGGDLAVRMMYHGVDADQQKALDTYGAVSASANLRGMARAEDATKSTLVEVKAVDDAYPMVGKVEFSAPAEGMTLAAGLRPEGRRLGRGGRPGGAGPAGRACRRQGQARHAGL